MVPPGPPAPPGPPGPLPPNENRGPEIIGVTISFLMLALAFYGARMYTRIRILRNIWWDDWIISASMLCALVGGILQSTATRYGFGRHVYYIPLKDGLYSGRLGFTTQNLFVCGLMFTKLSMAVMILRIQRSPLWIGGLSCLIAYVVATWIGSMTVNFLQCVPYQGNWDPFIPNLRCWSAEQRALSFYIISGINISQDLIYAILPLSFIFQIRRPLREKVVLAILMGFGIFATAAGTVKLIFLANFKNVQDASWELAPVAIWSKMEEHVGIIAACTPCLKSSFEKVLHRLGLLSQHSESRYNFSGESSSGKGSKKTPKLSLRDSEAVAGDGSEVELVPFENGQALHGMATAHLNRSVSTARTFDREPQQVH